MPRPEKETKVKELADRLSATGAALLAGYRGLTVPEAAELRAALAETGTRFSVVKNSLTRLAVHQAGLDGLTDLIDGPTAIAFVSGDPVAGAKRLVEQARRFPVLEIRGGLAEGRILTADEVRALAALDSREAMLARVAGMAKGQIARTAWLMKALQARFVLVMQALRDKLPAQAEVETRAEPAGEAPEAPAAEDHPDAERPGGEPAPAEKESVGEPLAETETEPSRPGDGHEGGEAEEGGS